MSKNERSSSRTLGLESQYSEEKQRTEQDKNFTDENNDSEDERLRLLLKTEQKITTKECILNKVFLAGCLGFLAVLSVWCTYWAVTRKGGTKGEVEGGPPGEPGDKECQELAKAGRDFLTTGQPGRERMKGGKDEEGLRLLAGERKPRGRAVKISQAATKLMSLWPGTITTPILVLLIATILLLITITTFIFLMHHQRIYKEFCPGIEKRNLVRGDYFNTRRDPGLITFDPEGNIFMPTWEEVGQDSACSLESALRASPNKNIFLLKVGDTHHSNTLKYERYLQNAYPNLKVLNRKGYDLLGNSPFWELKLKERGLARAAGVIALWEFGGGLVLDPLILIAHHPVTPSCTVHSQGLDAGNIGRFS